MEITAVRIFPTDDQNTRAYATIILDDGLAIRDIRITSSKKGVFIFMPSRKYANGKRLNIAFPVNSETRQMIEEKILAEYEKIAGEPVKNRTKNNAL